MPTYSFIDIKTGKTWDEFMSLSEREIFLKKNKHIKQEITGTTIVREVDGVRRIDSGFRDLLTKIKEGSPRSTVKVR